jgi:tetratricopeptide (TPR) repeat protein
MFEGRRYRCQQGWSWKRFFVSLTVVLTIGSLGLWWYSGRFPYSPEEVRFRVLMVQYIQTKSQLDRMYMEAGSSSVSQFNMDRKISRLCESFETFLIRYPGHDQAMNVYGSFLDDIGKGDAAVEWWERAVEFSHHNPQLLNNLANYYGHNGRAEDAIKLYEEAIKLDPGEPIYHFNLGNMYYLFRKETNAIHGWDLRKTFEHSLLHFRMARDLAPSNSEYAISYAETYYGVKFLSKGFEWRDAEAAWKVCLSMENQPEYQDSIRVHLVRINSYQGNSAIALDWYGQIKSPGSRHLAWQIIKRFFPDEMGSEI